MKFNGNEWEFTSGHKRYSFSEQLGVSFDERGEPSVSYGHDGGFWMVGEDEWKEPEERLSQADLLEMAGNQIQRWQRFAEWVRSSHNTEAIRAASQSPNPKQP